MPRPARRCGSTIPKVPGQAAINACCDVVNRGVAAWKGRIYLGTLDGRLIALDAAPASLLWEVKTVPDGGRYTITGAPRIVKGMVLIGNGGGEMGVRGYVTAYDADDGKQVWRFYTVPGDPSKPFESPGVARRRQKPGAASGGSSAAAARYGTRSSTTRSWISSTSAWAMERGTAARCMAMRCICRRSWR